MVNKECPIYKKYIEDEELKKKLDEDWENTPIIKKIIYVYIPAVLIAVLLYIGLPMFICKILFG